MPKVPIASGYRVKICVMGPSPSRRVDLKPHPVGPNAPFARLEMLTAERAAATIFAVLKIGRSNENGYSIVLPSLSIEFGARCAFDNGPMGIKGIQATFFRAPKVRF